MFIFYKHNLKNRRGGRGRPPDCFPHRNAGYGTASTMEEASRDVEGAVPYECSLSTITQNERGNTAKKSAELFPRIRYLLIANHYVPTSVRLRLTPPPGRRQGGRIISAPTGLCKTNAGTWQKICRIIPAYSLFTNR